MVKEIVGHVVVQEEKVSMITNLTDQYQNNVHLAEEEEKILAVPVKMDIILVLLVLVLGE